jgi:hypothetical protein
MKLPLSIERLTFLAALVVAGLLLWQSLDLDAWSILGPGPGLFPQLTTGFCCVVAGLLAAFPRLARSSADRDSEPDPALTADERWTFFAYALALPFLAIAAAYLGFFATSLVLVMALTWAAERKSWKPSLTYAVGCGLVGVVGFGHYLAASIPTTGIDELILRLVR